MIEVHRTYDLVAVRELMRHPRIYSNSVDDGCPSPEKLVLSGDSRFIYLLVRNNQEVLGFFILVPYNLVCYGFHASFLPSAWGPPAFTAGLMFLSWVWLNTPAWRLTAEIPAFNSLALRYARRLGLTRYGVNPHSFLKGGKLYDQVLMGASRR